MQCATGPPQPLADEFACKLRRRTGREQFVQVIAFVSARLELDGSRPILAQCLAWKAADFFHRLAPHDEAGAVAERRAERVTARLRGAEKHLLLFGDDAGQAKVPAHRVDTVEVLRRLHETDLGVAEKSDSALEKILCRNEICVEHRDQLAAT